MTGAPADALVAIPADEFDLDLTLECGQVFHWQRLAPGWLGAIGDCAVYAEQRGASLLVPAGTETLCHRYFALDHPLGKISATFPSDATMARARQFCRGMRIIRQPPWECLATFITSSMKQVAHIAQMSHAIRRRFGQQIEWNGRRFCAYPRPDDLARSDEAAFANADLVTGPKIFLAPRE
jgi:N-glycosylase/DNA lyase